MHLKEYVGAESLHQSNCFVAEMADEIDTKEIIRHDDACHLRRYADGRSQDSALACRIAYPSMRYITDGLHGQNHVDPWCLENCSPKAERNILAVAGDNSQVCEQLFAKIGRHKHVVRHMEKVTSRCFLTELADVKNEKCLATINRRDA